MSGPNSTTVNTVVEHSAQESRHLIDEKIADFQESIRQLKSQRNELAPISRLPPEVLSTIFSYVAAQTRFPTWSIVQRYYFTHVSQTWRSIAINSPPLWRVLPSSISCAEVMLERSKAVDLAIRLRFPDYMSISGRPVLFWSDTFRNHASRIRDLELTEISKSILSVLLEDLQPSSLSLHSLRLSGSSREDPSTFPTAIIETNNLQSLSVAGYDGAWYSLPMPCLTELKIHNISHRPRLAEFIETLRGTPYLQRLDMEESLPLASEPIDSIPCVKLPNLRRLLLSSGKTKEVANILSCIIVPSTATLKLDCKTTVSIQHNRDILTYLAKSLLIFFSATTGRAVPYTDIRIYSEGFCLYLSAWETCDSHHRLLIPNLELNIDPKPYMKRGSILKAVLPSLPLLKATTLTLELDSVDTGLMETLRNLSSLQSVTLIGRCTFDFIAALVHKPKYYYAQTSAFYSVSFPALQSLRIEECSFGPGLAGICPIDHLRDCLMERYERKAELTKLTLTDCYDLYSEDVDLLEEIVVDVEWDGCEMEEPRSEDDDESGGDSEGYTDDDYYDDYDPSSLFGYFSYSD